MDPYDHRVVAGLGNYTFSKTLLGVVRLCWNSTTGVSRKNVTSQDFVKFWGNFLLLYCLRWLKIHRDLKLLSLFESFNRKCFKLSTMFLKTPFWEKNQLSKYFFSNLYSNLCKFACKGVNPKGILFSEDCISRTKFER
jgi:hypothetical protein